jgi:hypothetical protein
MLPTRGAKSRGHPAVLAGLVVSLIARIALGEGGPPTDGVALWQASLTAQRLPNLRSEVTLETTIPSGEKITLTLHAVSKIEPDGINRMLMARVVSGGGSLFGTTFLSVEHLKDPDDLWMYLPALGHPKRITSSNLGDSFIGSEFTFGDLIQPEPDAYVVIVRPAAETVGGEPCWVVEARPREASLERGTGVSREVRWLGSRDLLERRIEQYDRRGDLGKVMEVRNWASYGEPPRWLAANGEITNVRARSSSQVVFGDVRISPSVGARFSAPRRCRTGRGEPDAAATGARRSTLTGSV